MLHLALSLALLQPAPARLHLVDVESPAQADARGALLDPHEGGVRASEVGFALGGYLVGDAATLALFVAGSFMHSCRGDVCGVSPLTVVSIPIQVVLAPTLATLGAWLASEEPLAGSLGRSMITTLVVNAAVGSGALLFGLLVPSAAIVPVVGYLLVAPLASALTASFWLHTGSGPDRADQPPPEPPPPPQPRDPRFDPPPGGVALRF